MRSQVHKHPIEEMSNCVQINTRSRKTTEIPKN